MIGISQDVLKTDSTIKRRDGFYESIDFSQDSYATSNVQFALKPTVLTKEIVKVDSEFSEFGGYIINVEFNDFGTELFYRLTSRNVGKPIAIFIDNKIISSPFVNSPIIGGKVQIQGGFDKEEMQRIVKILSH